MIIGIILAVCSIAFSVESGAHPTTELSTKETQQAVSGHALRDDLRLVPIAPAGEVRRFDLKNGVVVTDETASGPWPEGEVIFLSTIHDYSLPLIDFGPAADDISTICLSADLTWVEALVNGLGDGTGPGFDIQFALYDACPSDGGSPIAGTHHTASLKDDGQWIVSLDLADNPIPISGVVWLQVRSNSMHAGWAVGGIPEIGTSEDRMDTAMKSCNTSFGGCIGPCANGYAVMYGINCDPVPPLPTGACCTSFSNGDFTCTENTMPADCDGLYREDALCEPDPFAAPCGTASCCMLDETCVNMTKDGCEVAGGYWAWPRTCEDQGYFCPPLACITATNGCYETNLMQGGCSSVNCCEAICIENPSCCDTAWDESCVLQYMQECVVDECTDALPITCNDSLILDNTHATINMFDPSFGCPTGGPFGSVWAKFTPDETSALVFTCNSLSPADDSILALYSGTCGNLSLLACSGHLPGCHATGLNSVFCANDITPGETYYIQLASSTEAARGRYNLEILCPVTTVCAPPSQPGNDDCSNAIPIDEGVHPFTTVSSTTDGPLLPAPICNEGFDHDLGHDVWFNYAAPGHGIVTIDICSGTEFDSGIAVYEGCQCPAQTVNTIACNDDGCPPEDPEVGGASRVTFEATHAQCYKIRVGGYGPFATGTGEMVVSFSFIEIGCPDGSVMFIDPPNGTIDARQPHSPSNLVPLQGIDSFSVHAPAGADASCWRMCETSSFGSPNSISGVTDNGNGSYTIHLARPLTPGAATRISYTPMSGPSTTGTFYAHPANVNGDNIANPVDILRIIDCLNGIQPNLNCPYGIYSRDIDHSGVFNPADILRVIDLLNGADLFDVWNGTTLPTNTCIP